MKISRYILPMMVSATMMSGVAYAQMDTSGANTTTTPTNTGTDAGSTGNTPTTTQVEIRNEAPAAPVQQAPAPNIDIKMPDAPDVNITTPGNSGTNTSTTTRESSERVIIDDRDDVDGTSSNNVLMFVLFGVLAVFVIGMIIMASTRRSNAV